MATTPIYGFVTPDLSGTADGPAAMSALALRVEREMSVWRATNSWSREANDALSLSNYVAVHSQSVASAAIGWAEVEAEVFLISLVGIEVYIAGFIYLKCNGTTLRSIRYHNQGKTLVIEKSCSAAVALPSSVTTLAVEIGVTADGASGGHTAYSSNLSVRQYGAPVSG